MKMRIVTTKEELQEGDHLVLEEVYKAVALLLMENSLFPFTDRSPDVCPTCHGNKTLPQEQTDNPVKCWDCLGSGKDWKKSPLPACAVCSAQVYVSPSGQRFTVCATHAWERFIGFLERGEVDETLTPEGEEG